MADFTKTITNGINVFGQGPSTKWGQANSPYTMVWGTSKWGEDNAQTPLAQNSIPFTFTKVIDNQPTITNTVAISTQFRVTISNTQVFAFETSSENLTDGSGRWNYVYVSDTTNADERDFASWTSVSASSTSFTCGTAGTTSWTVG